MCWIQWSFGKARVLHKDQLSCSLYTVNTVEEADVGFEVDERDVVGILSKPKGSGVV